MNKILETRSGNQVFADENGQLVVKGDVSVLLQELAKDREDTSLPFQVHNTCVMLHTLISAGVYVKEKVPVMVNKNNNSTNINQFS